jgi:hypothetical protein
MRCPFDWTRRIPEACKNCTHYDFFQETCGKMLKAK